MSGFGLVNLLKTKWKDASKLNKNDDNNLWRRDYVGGGASDIYFRSHLSRLKVRGATKNNAYLLDSIHYSKYILAAEPRICHE